MPQEWDEKGNPVAPKASWDEQGNPVGGSQGTPISDKSSMRADTDTSGIGAAARDPYKIPDITNSIENYTPEGRTEHPVLSRIGDVTRGAKELLYGGQEVNKPLGTSSGVMNNPVTSAMAMAPAAAEVAEMGTQGAARILRNPATARQSQMGRPGTVKDILPHNLQRYTLPDWLFPKGELGTPTNPGPFNEIPSKMPKGLGTVGSPAQEAGSYPAVTRVPIRPTPPYKLTPESVPGPDTAGKGNLLSPLAKQGDPRAAAELLRRGRKVIYVPAENYPPPRSSKVIATP